MGDDEERRWQWWWWWCGRLLICDPTTTFPCWWRRWRGAGGGGGESGAFLGYRSVWVSLGHLATTTTGQSRRQLHDESESLLIISLSAQLSWLRSLSRMLGQNVSNCFRQKINSLQKKADCLGPFLIARWPKHMTNSPHSYFSQKCPLMYRLIKSIKHT